MLQRYSSFFLSSLAFLMVALFATGSILLPSTASAQDDEKSLTTPKEQLGHNLGDDYFLANYSQLVEYWKKLESESPRMKLEVIGKTEEGRDMWMAIITSPANHRRLAHYQEISKQLALAEGLHDETARELAAEGKAVVWIDGGLHASETLVAQQLMETVYQLCLREDEETKRILDNVIILCNNPNPDGQELVANWYMRHENEEDRTLRNLPRLYQKYIGHDNNRDFYMVSMKETEALCRIFYREWFPQIIFNHHQTGPAGTVLFAPPFRGPFNHNFDPLVPLGINAVGAAIHSRFAVEGKPGATMRNGASYSTWWNGGLRTNAYFHNMIGLLTETIGSPTPTEIPLRTQRLLATDDLPYPIKPQKWHFRQSLDYSVTSNWAVLDYAARNREHLLFNIYRMGKNSIDKGNRDHWTLRPHQIAAAEEAMREGVTRQQVDRNESGAEGAEAAQAEQTPFERFFQTPESRDPRGYIIPADQHDFLTATKFVNILFKNGVLVHRATGVFEVNGKVYPAGSYIVKTAQAFRPHVLDMFEPQDHPDDFAYPGGPPTPPYDSAGWTLAFQMGVEFDRILDGFDGPFERIESLLPPPSGTVIQSENAVGFLFSHDQNDSFVALNRLTKAGESVFWLKQPIEIDGEAYPAGTNYVKAGPETVEHLKSMSKEIGLDFVGVQAEPDVSMLSLTGARVGLWDRYGGSMDSGWVRWILEQFEFDFRRVFAQELDKGDLIRNFDVLIFVDGSLSSRMRNRRQPALEEIPSEYHDHLGSLSEDKTIPMLKQFLESGGTILTIGSATQLAEMLEIEISNPLETFNEEGQRERLDRDVFYVPGSVLEIQVDSSHAIGYGTQSTMDTYYNNNPLFRLSPTAQIQGARPVAWFSSDRPLRSGWAWGQHYLKDAACIVDVPYGKGNLVLFGPEITYRSQPHASFKFLFNAIYYGPSSSKE